MKVYLITDTHFNHKKIIEYCGRPENYEELLWKSLEGLPKDALLIHLGDICIGGDKEVNARIGKLQCKKILVRGNHDRETSSWYLTKGWDFVCENFTETFFGQQITFSHVPIAGIKNLNIHGHFHNTLHRLQQGNWVVEGEKERNEDVLKILTDKHKLLAVEYTDYKAVSLQDFIK